MPNIPAFCDRCGAIFPSGFVVENSSNVSFAGCSAGPCPSCGGVGHIPDGVYSFIGNTIELLSGPGRTVFELDKLANILRSTRRRGVTIDQIKEEVCRETPELTSILDLLPRTRQDVYQFISILIAVISLIVTLNGSDKKVEVTEIINYVFQNSVEEREVNILQNPIENIPPMKGNQGR